MKRPSVLRCPRHAGPGRHFSILNIFSDSLLYVGWELASIDGDPMCSVTEVQQALGRCDRSPGRDDLGAARFCFRKALPSESPVQDGGDPSLNTLMSIQRMKYEQLWAYDIPVSAEPAGSSSAAKPLWSTDQCSPFVYESVLYPGIKRTLAIRSDLIPQLAK